MKVVKEAVKEQKAVASLRRGSMRNPVPNGVSPVSQIDAIESKSSTNEQNLGEKFPPFRVQQSMRRSKFSGELERDMAFPAPQPSARLATTTPLNPVTPLRWKSSKRLELEKKKLQEDLKTKEVAKEDYKNSKLTVKEEKKDQHTKMIAIPKLQANAMEVSHKANKETRFAASASISGSMVLPQTNGKTRDMKRPPSVTIGSSDEHAIQSEEGSPPDAEHGIDRSNGDVSETDRKSLPGDESSVITIDFLRARLLSERASSKAEKERVQQLTNKVLELEGRLDQEIQSRKKAEDSAQEALLKFELQEKIGKQASKESSKIFESTTSVSEKLWGSNQVTETDISKPLSPHGRTKIEQDQALLSNQEEQKCQLPLQVHDAEPNATEVTMPDHTRSVPLDIKDGSKQVTSEVKIVPSSEQEIGDRHRVQCLEKIGLQEVKQDSGPPVQRMESTSCSSISSVNSGLHERQERRSGVEERLRHMWDQMREEMAALAEDKTQEELVREELLHWMGQVPSVLQDVLPKPSEDKELVVTSSTKNVQLKDRDVPLASLIFNQDLKEDKNEDLSLKGASSGDKSRIQDKGLKKVASLIERFEAQETNQREWEQNYAKRNSTSRRRSNEGSMTMAHSNSGTPHSLKSQQESDLEQLEDVAPKIQSQNEDPRFYSNVTSSSVSPSQCISIESFLTRKENGKVDIQTPEIRTPSTDPDPPTVEEVVERSEGGITYSGTQRTDDFFVKSADLGSERSLVPSFITPPQSMSSGPDARENEKDIRRNPADRSQVVLKQSEHHLNPRALEGTYEALVGHPRRSNLERDQPPRSQTLAGWVNLEDAQTHGMPTDKGDSALLWDASFVDLHLRHDKLASYLQAGNSNAYTKPEVPGIYPLRNDEREVYRGRMESVSRSMEGLGSSWRSISDPEGDELQPYADISVANESGTTRRSRHQMPFQVNRGSGRSNNCQAESMVGSSPNSAYTGREFSRDNFQCRSSTKLESSTSKVNEVLKALQLAKLSIQKTGGRRPSMSNTCYSTNEHSCSGGKKHNVKTDCGFYGGDGMTNKSPVAIHVWSHQELSRRYSTGSFREAGSPPHLQHSSPSVPLSMIIDARGKDHEEDHPLAGRSSPVSNARRKFVDKISTGGAVQYIYPN